MAVDTLYKKINVNEFDVNNVNKYPFHIYDVVGYVKDKNIDYDIYDLSIYDEDCKLRRGDLISHYLNILKDESKPSIIVTRSYISRTEFPPDKYYLNDSDKEDGKEELPVQDILDREAKEIESFGFAIAKNYRGLEFSDLFIFDDGSDIVKDIIENLE